MDGAGESDSIIGKLIKGAVGLVSKVVNKAKQALKKKNNLKKFIDASLKIVRNAKIQIATNKSVAIKNYKPKPIKRVVIRCPLDDEMKTVYSFADAAVYKDLVYLASSKARSVICGVDPQKIVQRAEFAMEVFDRALEQFKTMIGFNKEYMIIEVDYLADAIADFSVELIRDYKKPKEIGQVQLENPTYGTIKFSLYFSNIFDKLSDFKNLVGTNKPFDIKDRDSWRSESIGKYIFRGICRENDYLGNYIYGIVGKEMFTMHEDLDSVTNFIVLYGAGCAQQVSNQLQLIMNQKGEGESINKNEKDYAELKGMINWAKIVFGSSFSETGDNKDDVEKIKDGMKRWEVRYER